MVQDGSKVRTFSFAVFCRNNGTTTDSSVVVGDMVVRDGKRLKSEIVANKS
jgi:hypothetical protein